MKHLITIITITLVSILTAQAEFPVKGIHFSAPNSEDVEMCVKFINEELPKFGVNTMILEVNYGYQYASHPELASGLSKDELLSLYNACKENGIEFIPMINCLGHQSWSRRTGKLLTTYPEFDETPGKYPNNEDIYCRSYCPNHPEVHKVMFALMDELCELTNAKSFHVGLDETFILADKDCPRCKDKSTAEVFAHEVNTLSSHLKEKGIKMWMWGDRFLDGEVTGIGEWEASKNGTAPAINMVSKDNLVICDWHYEKPHPTMIHFALMGFDVLPSPWRKPEVALGQLKIIQQAQESSSEAVSSRLKGMLHTTWCGMSPFVRAYHGQLEDSRRNRSAIETVECFKTLFGEFN